MIRKLPKPLDDKDPHSSETELELIVSGLSLKRSA